MNIFNMNFGYLMIYITKFTKDITSLNFNHSSDLFRRSMLDYKSIVISYKLAI